MQKYLFNNFLGKGIMNKELVNRLTLFMLEGVKLTEEEKIEAIQKVLLSSNIKNLRQNKKLKYFRIFIVYSF